MQGLPGINIPEGQLRASKIMKQTHYDSVMFACILKLTIETTIYYKNECLKFAKMENKMQQAKLQSVTNDSQRFPPPMSKQRRNRFFFFFF